MRVCGDMCCGITDRIYDSDDFPIWPGEAIDAKTLEQKWFMLSPPVATGPKTLEK